MSEMRRPFYKNILGDTKETINAIQRFIEKNSPAPNNSVKKEENDLSSINRVINSIADENTSAEIDKIIKNL